MTAPNLYLVLGKVKDVCHAIYTSPCRSQAHRVYENVRHLEAEVNRRPVMRWSLAIATTDENILYEDIAEHDER